jgi:hypothetical protein
MSDRSDPISDKVNQGKRDFIKTLIAGTAFTAPQVASFSMEGLKTFRAHAQGSVSAPPG